MWKDVPPELIALPRWTVWKYGPSEDPNKKPRKVILDVHTGMHASVTNPATWCSFEDAVRRLEDGCYEGLVFTICKEDGYVFIDLDDCRNDSNKLNKPAKEALDLFKSYSEVSPSDKGIHIVIKGKKPGDKCKVDGIEIYDAHFMVVTGRWMSSCGTREIENRQEQLEQFYRKYLDPELTGKGKGKGNGNGHGQSESEQIVEEPIPEDKLNQLLENEMARAIWEGTTNGRYPSQSAADWHICKIAIDLVPLWSDAQLATLIRTARRAAGKDDKHENYYPWTIERARGESMELAEAHEVVNKWLSLPDVTIFDVTLAVVARDHPTRIPT
jgi:primase-polymerase (primpol)-like protein